jgi:hypothetical protein
MDWTLAFESIGTLETVRDDQSIGVRTARSDPESGKPS